MSKTFRLFLALALLGLAFLGTDLPTSAQTASEGFKLVVHRANRVDELSRREVSRLFLKKSTIWGDGQTAEPVDLAPDHRIRERFSQSIHDKDVSRIQAYWQRMMFSGRASTPPEMGSEKEVLEYVATHPYAIGYIAANTAVNSDVRVIRLSD